jgi:hypothetical protein
MRLLLPVVAAFLLTNACAPAPKPIEFLTRSGCVQTKIMQLHLDQAIKAIGTPVHYTVTDLDTLPRADVRTGYGTPTILRGGDDLFGVPVPTPPYPEPT